MTWREIINKAAAYLAAKGVEDADVAAEFLAARLLNVGRGFLAPRLEGEPTSRQLEAMRRGMARLAKGEPVQYVLGEWDFRSLTIACDSCALIPRPETEELVTRVLTWLGTTWQPAHAGEKPLLVDVGTGTGAIILSLAKEYAAPAVFIGTDVSEGAVALATENAARCGLSDRVRFVVADGLDDFDEPQCMDVIVSNPPYIASRDCESLPRNVRDYEPRLALDGGASGLDFYERYLADALNLLKPGGAVFFEIGETQGAALRDMMQGYGFTDIRIERDFAGHDRYAFGSLAT